MQLSTQKLVQFSATAAGILSLLWCLFVTFISFVDPVAIMFAYFALPFVGLGLFGNHGWLILKLFGVVLIASHLVAISSAIMIEKNAAIVSTKPIDKKTNSSAAD